MTPKPSQDFLELMAEKFRLLGDPTRLLILRCLVDQGELNVRQIVCESGGSTANVSRHLKQLAETRMIGRRKQGSFVFYRLSDPVVAKICKLVCDALIRELEEEVKRSKKILRRRQSP